MNKIFENNKFDKPILILEQSQSIVAKIFTFIFTAFMIFTAFLGVGGITLDEIKFKITGLILLIFAPLGYFYILKIKQILCYDDFLIVKYPFWQSIFYYDDIRYYWHNFRMQTLQIFQKNANLFCLCELRL